MADTEKRLYSYLFFKAKEVNGKTQPGKFDTLKVRFLYASMDQIPFGKVHLYSYAPKKVTRVYCLNNDKTKKELDKANCPLCQTEQFGIPSGKFYAFVTDENDDGALKLLEFNWSLGQQIDEIANIKGRPLHDMVFTLSKKGIGKDTTYTPIFEEVSKFDVADYFATLGINDYPIIVGTVADKAPILSLTYEQIQDFIDGQYPWSTGEGATQRKFTHLGSTVTLRGGQTEIETPKDAEIVETIEDGEPLEYVADTPKTDTKFF